MFNTPILIILFNRPESSRVLLKSLKAVRPSRLFIAIDGPRTGNKMDEELVGEVQTIFEQIEWECEVKRLNQENNLGCSKGPINAINWFFSNVESGIILEDDCIPSPDFFPFCESLLEFYKNDEKILNICGSNMGFNNSNSYGYFYSRFMNMSGWATWRRCAINIDYKLTSWKGKRNPLWQSYKIFRQGYFDMDLNWYKYWKEKFDKTITEDNISWWDWQWIYYQLTTKKYSIIPNQNLVTNIGFNEMATHTKDPNNPLANIPVGEMKFPLNHPSSKKPNFYYEEYAVKWVWCYHKRLPKMFYLKQLISKILHAKK
jgi:hypothetical protein